SPADFIPEAERRGLILPIGDFVLDAVHRFASENELEKLGLSYIEINLSVAQCLERELPSKMEALSNKYSVGPDKVNLEITETSYDNIGDIMDENLKILSEQGYSFSLDDYGVGYSNIQRVSKLPLKIVKIDKSLVDNMNTVSGKSIMNNTVRMMKDINKELVIEGVETKEDFDALRQMGCDFIQGFYFSKPLPAREFIEFLKENNLGA
ncbi:MAG: EAL domain-containing protein, partial [Lachnospiraceae bacterium]|nr:EAL domain-containing protein [Lachnospiraceae bacterium]